MAVLDKAKLDEVSRGFRAVFLNSELDTATRSLFGLIVNEYPVSGNELKMKFASRQWGVEEWLDSRKYSELKNFDSSIVMKKWSNGLRVDVADLEDDENALAMYSPEIADMRDDFDEHRLELAIDLLANGFAATKGVLYDGQFLFDSDHQDMPGGPVQSNVATGALSAANFRSYREKMWQWKKPNGKLARVNPDTILIPVALSGTAEGIFDKEYDSNGATNTLFGAVRTIVEPRLDAYSTTAWYLIDSRKRVRPVAMGNRKAVQFRAMIDPNDEVVFDRDEVRFGADGRYNAGYGYWQAIHGSDGTV